MFSHFYKSVNSVINKLAPLRHPNKNIIRNRTKPWITRGLRNSIKKKNQFLESDDKIKYKLYRNRITSLTRLSKKMYFHSYFQQGINMLISNNKKSRKSITNLKDPSTNKLAYKRNEVANILNKHFATIGQKLSSDIPDSNTQFTEFLRDINVNESFFNPVTPEEVELEILQTPSIKSFGLYSFPINILKSSRCILSSPIATIINTSISSGTF